MELNRGNSEAQSELEKPPTQQINDLIDETNKEMNGADSVENNLDRIKHILKRIGFQQAAIDYKTSKTNKILIWLTCIAALPAIEAVIKFIDFLIRKFS